MLRMLKADLFRIRKERLSLVSLVLLIGLGLSIGYGVSRMGISAADSALGAVQILTPFLCLFFITPAKIFFGEDFANRTINNSIIKTKGRLGLYSYRSLATILFCLLYVVIGFLAIAVSYQLFTGKALYSQLLPIISRQSIFYLASACLAVLVFNCFSKMYQSNTAYLLLVLIGEQFYDLFFSFVLKTTAHKPFMIFNNLKEAIGKAPTTTVILASLFWIALFVTVSYTIFSKRAFK